MGIADRKQREFERREREILDAALTLLAGEDWMSVTVDQIAAAAEIGKGTVYKHFESKEEIYGRLALEFHSGIARELQQLDPGLAVEPRIREIMRVFWRAYTGRPEYQRIVEYTSRESFRQQLSPELRDAFEHLNLEQMGIYASVLELGMQQGLFPRRPIELAFIGPQALVSGMILMVWSGCFASGCDDTFIDELTNFMLAGLKYRPDAQQITARSARPALAT